MFQCLFNISYQIFVVCLGTFWFSFNIFMVWFLLDLGSGDIEAVPRNGADCIAFGEGED